MEFPKENNLRLHKWTTVIATLGFLLITLAQSWYYSEKYGGCDLRARTIASRHLARSQSPYFYKWKESDGPFFLDPNQYSNRTVCGTSVTPAMLYIIYPLSILPYQDVRRIWTLLLYLMLAGTMFLVIMSHRGLPFFYPSILIILGMVCANNWLFNIERGQVYMVYSFMLALSYYLMRSRLRHAQLIAGFVAGVLILLRPLTAVIGLAFLGKFERKWLLGNILGFVTGCLLFVAPNPGIWKDYLRAMNAYSNLSVIDRNISGKLDGPQEPAAIEGMTNLRLYKDFKPEGLFPMYLYFNSFGFAFGLKYFLLMYAGVIAMLMFLFYRIPGHSRDPDIISLFGFLLYILLELFIVAPRPGYSLIQWIFPLYIITLKFQQSGTIISLIIAAFMLYHGFPFLFLSPYQFQLTELMFIIVTLYSVFQRGNKMLPAKNKLNLNYKLHGEPPTK